MEILLGPDFIGKTSIFHTNLDFPIWLRSEEMLANQKSSVLQELRYLLTATKIDESKSIVGGESVYKNLLNEYEEEIVKMKMLKIIQSL